MSIIVNTAYRIKQTQCINYYAISNNIKQNSINETLSVGVISRCWQSIVMATRTYKPIWTWFIPR